MSINVELIGGKTNKYKAQVHRRNGDVGLVVYTEALHEKELLFSFALNPDIGFEMAINGSFGGTPGIIHVGDLLQWEGTSIIGNKVDFEDSFSDGSEWTSPSVESNKSVAGDTWQFDNGSDIDISTFVGLSLDIYVLSGWITGNSVSIYGYNTGTGLRVGNSVLLEDYFNEEAFGVGQSLGIPLADMGLQTGTIDAIRVEILSKAGAGVVFYCDNIQLEQTSGAKIFTIEAPPSTKYHITELKFTYIGPLDTTLTANSMPNLSYNKILNVGKLNTGITFSRIKDGVALFTANITCLADSTRGGSTLENMYSDGTNTHVTVSTKFLEPVVLNSRNIDSLNITINDDLSSLISFTAVAIGYTTTTNHEDIS